MKKIFSLGKLFCAFPSYKIARLVNLLLQAELGNYDFFENEIISIKRNIRYPNDATFFKTQEQFTQAVNGAYSALRGVSARQGYLMGEMRSDNTHYTRYKADRGLHI